MLLFNKYSPKHHSQSFFHKDILERLKLRVTDDGISHIIVHGRAGSGKKTLIRMFLEMCFDDSIYKLKKRACPITSGSTKTKNIEIIDQSRYHIIIEPKGTNNDKYIISDIVKQNAISGHIKIFTNSRQYKVIQINNLQNLSELAQAAFRRILEDYSSTCKFIMYCDTLSRVIPPLRSRCECIRLPSPTKYELYHYIAYIIRCEEQPIPHPRIIMNMAKASNGNIKEALLIIQNYLYDNKCIFGHTKGLETSYQKTINEIVSLLLTKNNVGVLTTLREKFYSMFMTNINVNKQMRDLLDAIIKSGKFNKYIYEISKCFVHCDRSLRSPRRIVPHICDALCSDILRIINPK